jgi:hypothetical protein
MVREADVTLKLKIGGETVETTAEHPFHTQDGWKDAADLDTSDSISRKDNSPEKVKSAEYDYNPKKVFNFEVADWHTYFVGVWAWLVHNAKACFSAYVKKVSDGVYDITLKFKSGWTKSQREAAVEKAQALTNASTKVVKNPARKPGTRKVFEKAGGKIKGSEDVDHVIDLQLDGADDVMNMKGLDSSVNRSIGSQIQNRIKDLPEGTAIRNVDIID